MRIGIKTTEGDMSDVYEESYCHLVWAATRREAMIQPPVEEILCGYIRQKSREKKAFVYALGGMPDHVHLVCSIPVTIAVCEFVKLIKGSSSHCMSHHTQSASLRWQRGYSYLTFSKHDLPAVVHYVDCQKERHADNKLWPKLKHLPAED